MVCISSALIVGGGIAGLSAAMALSRAGVRCDVVELSDANQGASIGISGRAASALVELGVYDRVAAENRPASADTARSTLTLRDRTGKVLGEGPKRPTWPGAVDAVAVWRPSLIKILEDQAKQLGASIRTGLTVEQVENDQDAVRVKFTDGGTGTYDLLILADGISSKNRSKLFPEAPKPKYAGQMSVRWMAPGNAVEPEGWYISPAGRLGFYHLPQGMVYVAAVLDLPEWRWLSDDEVRERFTRLLDSFEAPAVVELRRRLTPDSQLIGRPFEWVLVPDPWYAGRALLVGDAAHATTAHMGMGGGMALEDAAVLGQCVASAGSLDEALAEFMRRRFDRVRHVVDTSVELSRLEQEKAPPGANASLLTKALAILGEPY